MSISAMALKMAAKMAEKPVKVEKPIKVERPKLTGPEIPMAINTQYATIAVYGHHLVSKRCIELLGLTFDPMIWDNEKDHGVRILRFLDNGRPVNREGAKVLASCSPDLGGVLINLEYHFDRAIELAVEDPNKSAWFVFNQLLIQSYLHEACHVSVRQTDEDRKQIEAGGHEEEENGAEAWSFMMLCKLAKEVNIEPCRFSELPYFMMKWRELVGIAKADDEWFSKQKHMLDNHISYLLEPGEEGGIKHNGLTVNTFRQYLQLLAPDGDTSEDWEKPVSTVNTLGNVINAAAHKEYYVEASGAEVIAPVIAQTTSGFVCGIGSYAQNDNNLNHQAQNMGGFGQPIQNEFAADYMPETDEYGNVFATENDMSPDYSGGEILYDNNGFTTAEGFAAASGTEMFQIGTSFGATHPHAAGDFHRENGGTQPAKPVVQNIVYPQTGIPAEQTAEIVKGVYMKIYNHIFTNCGMLTNSDIAFQRPEAVTVMPIELTDTEKAVVVKMECMDGNGQWQRNMPTSQGLRGYVASRTKLPMYKIYINNGGREDVRTIMPQNTAKIKDGNLTRFAVEARNGAAIMYVIEGDDRKVQAGSKKWLFKINNHQWEAC